MSRVPVESRPGIKISKAFHSPVHIPHDKPQQHLFIHKQKITFVFRRIFKQTFAFQLDSEIICARCNIHFFKYKLIYAGQHGVVVRGFDDK